MSTRNKAGFTIIELLIVSAIIGLLSAVVLQSLNIARQKSRNATRLSQIDQINKAIELSATGGQNKLPYSGSTDQFQWACLGLSAGTCGGGVYGWYAPLNTAVASNIAGGIIPRDPSITGSIGDYYLYHSNMPAINSGSCTPTLCPAGAYLSWTIENNTNCGRGKLWIAVTAGNRCVLRVGDSVTN